MELPQGCFPLPKLGVIEVLNIQLGTFQSGEHHSVKYAQISHNCFDEVPVSGRKGRGYGQSPLDYLLEDVNLCLDSSSRPLRGISETQKARFPSLVEAVDEVRT